MKLNKSIYTKTSDSFFCKTLKQYEIDYQELLNYYSGLNEDNDEINFLISEIQLIKEYINPVVNNQKTKLEEEGILDLHIEMIKDNLSSYKKIIKFLETKLNEMINDKPNKTKPNKSLLFAGKDLNLLERYKIADKVLNVDKTIRKLNIQDLEKYQLLAYILGCDKDNARNLMNGTYNAKDRDLSSYFNELGLNK